MGSVNFGFKGFLQSIHDTVAYMKLELLIPQYNEDEGTVAALLSSVTLQQGVDFKNLLVSIYGDGGHRLEEQFIDAWPFRVRYEYNPDNYGVSHARNMLIDNAVGDYVQFFDSDDMFWTVTALNAIFRWMNEGFDVLSSPFIREYKLNDDYKECYSDNVHLHGKVIRLEYLRSLGIKFDENLRYQEDALFTPQVVELSDKMLMAEKPFYLWRYNPNSLTRSEKNFSMKTIPDVAAIIGRLADAFIARGKRKTAARYCGYMLCTAWVELANPKWDRSMDIVIDSELSVLAFMDRHKELLAENTEDEMQHWLSMAVSYDGVERIPYDEWVFSMVERHGEVHADMQKPDGTLLFVH